MLSAAADDGRAAAAAPQVAAEWAEATAPAAAHDSAAATEVAALGLLGKIKEKVGSTVEKVVDNERVQQGVDFVRKKTTELAELERVQKGIEIAKDTAKAVSEKTAQGIEIAKEKTKAMREGAGAVWQRGRGSIQRARAGVTGMAWKGSARDTLDMAAREDQWRNIKVQGAEELPVPARTEHTSAYHVSKGSTLRWTFRVKDNDIGFGVRMRVQEWGGSREDEVLSVERYDCADTISGSWVADEDRTMILAFDNRYSRLRSKTVAYFVGTEKPPVFTEPPPQASPAPVGAATAESLLGIVSEPARKAIV